MKIFLFDRTTDYERENVFIVRADSEDDAIRKFVKNCKWSYLINKNDNLDRIKEQLFEEHVQIVEITFNDDGVLFDNAVIHTRGGKVRKLSQRITLGDLFDSGKTKDLLLDQQISF